jgi:hypothetical protein
MTMMNSLKRMPHTGSWLDLRRSTSKALTLTNRRWSTTSSKRSSKAGTALAV